MSPEVALALAFVFGPTPAPVVPPPVSPIVIPVAPVVKDQFRGTDGVLYERCSDGIYRAVPSQIAPEVAAPKTGATFRDAHACPTCGQVQHTVSGWNRNGTHQHRCPVDGTVWSH